MFIQTYLYIPLAEDSQFLNYPSLTSPWRESSATKLSTLSGWWLSQPLWKMMEFVSWNDDILKNMEK